LIYLSILPNVEAVANLHFQTQKTVFESPHMKMSFIVELAWGFSTVLGKVMLLCIKKLVLTAGPTKKLLGYVSLIQI
jgi:hypothetical protein